MARITKLELEQRLAAAQAELVALRTEVSTLRADRERLSAQLGEAALAHAAASEKAFTSVEELRQRMRVDAKPLTAFQELCQRAREHAMRTGRVVKVG